MSITKLVVDASDPTPPFEQLRRQLAAIVGSGELSPGDRLPPVRQLAADLGLAPGTVNRAYRELERAGLVLSRAGRGTTVAAGVTVSPARRSDELAQLAAGFIGTARRLGADPEAIADAVAVALRSG